MYIGSLLEEKMNVEVEYEYLLGHSQVRIQPNYQQEAVEKEIYDNQGSLFQGTVGFDTFSFAGDSVDIPLVFNRTVYLDSLSLTLEIPCAQEISLFAEDGTTCLAQIKGEGNTPIQRKKITLLVDSFVKKMLLRFVADSKTAPVDENGVVTDSRYLLIGHLNLFGAVELEKDIYPTPREITYQDGFLKNITGIEADGEDAAFAAEYFMKRYHDLFGNVAFGHASGNIVFSLGNMPEEAFYIKVTSEKAEIMGGSRRALLFAVGKLLQCVTNEGIYCCEIEDQPAFPFRGIHIALPKKEDLPFLKRVFEYLIVPMGYNSVIIQLSGVMEYKTHPKINEMWLKATADYDREGGPKPAHYGFLGNDIYSHEDIKELCQFFRNLGMDVIPEVQSCSHVQYITAAYPDMAEIEPEKEQENLDILKADEKPKAIAPHSMCLKHPDYYKVIFDILDEVISVVKPAHYVHIGHDEIYTIGKCPRCKDVGAAKLFTDDITMMRNHLAEKGLKTMLWSDMMEETERYETTSAVDFVPKDIICLPFTWYFHLTDLVELEQRLINRGFSYLTGNLYSSHFPRFRKRTQNKYYLGGEVSNWVKEDEFTLSYEGKIFDYIYTAEMLWNPDFIQEMRRTQNRRIRKLLPRLRDQLHFDQTICSRKEILNQENQREIASINQPYSVLVKGKADAFSVLHATEYPENRMPWKVPEPIGKYVFHYADGTQSEEMIIYGYQLCAYYRPYAEPLSSTLFRHEGYIGTFPAIPKTGKENGRDTTSYEYRVLNPYPEKEVESFSVTSLSKITDIFIFAVTKEIFE